MTVSDLVSAVKQYKSDTHSTRSSSDDHPSPQQVIDILMARDEVYAARTAKTQTDKESLMIVISLDERLKKQSELINKLVKLADCIVESKQPGDIKWQKVGANTILNFDDLLRTTSNRGKKVAVKISCTNTLLPPWILSGNNPAVGVANKCLPPDIDPSSGKPIDF